MYYSELVKRACTILYEAHRDDLDKGGYPYVFHPFYLAAQMDDEATVCTALLHDVIEDHGDRYSFDDLARGRSFTRSGCCSMRTAYPIWTMSGRWQRTPSPGRSSWRTSGTTRTPGG